MRKVISNILLIIYVLFAIILTFCLVSRNRNGFNKVGDYAMVINPKKDSEILIFKLSSIECNEGDTIIFGWYDADNKYKINSGKISKINDNGSVVILNSDDVVDSKNVIGNMNNVKKIGFIGYIISFLESRYGYFITVVFPILVAFCYELYATYREFKKKKNEVIIEEK